jgi:hypothetical protein
MSSSARVLHVGEDVCFRISVMEAAGLVVCRSNGTDEGISEALRDAGISAVAFSQLRSAHLVSVARSLTPAPLILFRDPDVEVEESEFDVVIPPATAPARWLKSLATAIEDARYLQARSQQLRNESAAVRAKFREIRAEARRRRTLPVPAEGTSEGD